MDAPPIQYARTENGVNIAYWTLGEGPPLLHLVPHPFSHIELEWQVPALRDWYEKLAGRFQVVRLDFRSGGLSDDATDTLGTDAYVSDLEAVVRAIAADHLVIFAHSYACATAIRFAARYPDDVVRLALSAPWLTMPELHRNATEVARSLMQTDPDWFASTMAATRSGQQDAGGHFERVIRNAILPEVQPKLIEAHMAIDVREDATNIRCRTLIAASRFKDQLQAAREVATAIPSSKLIVFETDIEDPYFSKAEQALDSLIPFLSEGFADHVRDQTMGAQVPAASPERSPESDAAALVDAGLTKRELEVARLVAQGLSNNAIGEQLTISPGTVTRHVSNIFYKAGLSNRVELTRFAIDNELL
jgi:DNA-binding NarL/FixJ family response regulator